LRMYYAKICGVLVPLWEKRTLVAEEARHTQSSARTTELLMGVHGYGGTGFLAKEVVQDLLQTPLFRQWDPMLKAWVSICNDLNDWCAVGPGARRGLNRIMGRPTHFRFCKNTEVAHYLLSGLA